MYMWIGINIMKTNEWELFCFALLLQEANKASKEDDGCKIYLCRGRDKGQIREMS